MVRRFKYITLGCLTWVPGLHAFLKRGTGGSNSARYCYSVWMRHLVRAAPGGGPINIGSLAELGPGDSLGVGIAALLSGADRYLAFDAVPHARSTTNLAVFDELVELFRSRARIPAGREFAAIQPALDSHDFPAHLLPDDRLEAALDPGRVARLRRDLESLSGAVSYVPNWHERDNVPQVQVDYMLSQAVLEHVDQLEDTYLAMSRWLRPGGRMSHQIDFKCHSMADRWNGHLAYGDLVWRLMRGRLPYLLNRRLPSEHLEAARSAGLQVLDFSTVCRDDGLPRERLAPRFRACTDTDLRTAGAFMHAIRPIPASG